MEKLTYTISIKTTREKLWSVLWEEHSYGEWANYFNVGTYYIIGPRGWVEGETIKFVSADAQSGVYSKIMKYSPLEEVQFQCMGMIVDGQEVALDANIPEMVEAYTISAETNGIRLTATIDLDEEYLDFFNEVYPKALAKIKQLAEES